MLDSINIEEVKSENLIKNVDVRLACVEDGLENIGFRTFAAYVQSVHPNTKIAYVPTGNWRGFIRIMSERGAGNLTQNDINEIAKFLGKGDVIGLSSMTQYSSTVRDIISSIRKINPKAYIVWGGIHPIIQPEDAIKYADAVCTGEGEFAFKTFLELFKNGEDYSKAPSFWFNKNGKIIKNPNLPLMKP